MLLLQLNGTTRRGQPSALYGMTMDHTNPSLRAQEAKFGTNNQVKTPDTIPIRESFAPKGVKWDTAYTNWSQIHDQCIELVRWFNSTSNIFFLINEENIRRWRDYINLDETDEAIKIELQVSR
ncbi:hypothetical protein FPOAC2_10765 [Fusarium poae]|jgi:hypothetical protein|nr:hypothetical protein FPOAC1_010484 [Fusarium poae]KAG8665685.1 hypothetical protein FPOAC1_010484 [Fusarium poae]